jgi:hypothetical protein
VIIEEEGDDDDCLHVFSKTPDMYLKKKREVF